MQAMIFAAGLGTRFKPWTDQHPKALAVVNGKSLLQRNIEYLKEYGITNLIINVHHFAEQVKEAVRENKGWGSHISISDESGELLETGGGLLKAKPFFKEGQKFMTCNADILTDLDLHRLIAFHEKNKPLISFGITNRVTSRYLLFDKDMRLCGWRNTKTGEEKISIPQKGLVPMAYSTIALFEYKVFDLMEAAGFKGKFSLVDVYLELAKDQLIMGFDHSGDRFVDVGKTESIGLAASIFT
ncbi:MAG: NTP transferase domain-containing protein [Terrimonas sp.]|nr:NTP transferase domain-containing protein [Terrimonas sp.]